MMSERHRQQTCERTFCLQISRLLPTYFTFERWSTTRTSFHKPFATRTPCARGTTNTLARFVPNCHMEQSVESNNKFTDIFDRMRSARRVQPVLWTWCACKWGVVILKIVFICFKSNVASTTLASTLQPALSCAFTNQIRDASDDMAFPPITILRAMCPQNAHVSHTDVW